MKLSPRSIAAISCLLPFSLAYVNTGKEQFHFSNDYVGNSIWILGSEGVSVYSPDGQERKSYLDKSAYCHEEPKIPDDAPGYMRACRFQDAISDGKKYVWASITRTLPKIDLFDINSGAIVGSFDTCLSPSSLEYHPLRDEVWVRCSDAEEESTNPTHLDVFSASSPSGDIKTDILAQDRALKEGLSSQGHSVIDNSLGDVGYLTDANLPYLFKVDLSSKTILERIEMSPPPNGLNDVAFSPVNKHIFVRSELCCSCGFEGSDLGESCGRSDGYPVTPVTGVSAGQVDVNGICGSSCEGKPNIDTIGVYEFDTATDTVVATHKMAEGIGGDPYVSPDGKYIVLLGRNGGKTIRMIKVGEPGQPSTEMFDIELGFDRSGYEEKSVAIDFAFINKDDRTLVIFPSGTEHKIAVVDITNGADYTTRYITFNEDEFIPGRAPHGRYRRTEWAVGTDYVWVNDSSLNEAYVIDFMREQVVSIIKDVDVSQLLSVQNYEYMRQFEMQKQIVMDMMDGAGADSSKGWKPEAIPSSSNNNNNNSSNSSAEGLEVAAIVLGTIAIFVGIANCAHMMKMRKEIQNQTPKQEDPVHLMESQDDDSNVVPSVN